jgi:hypothetical protein
MTLAAPATGNATHRSGLWTRRSAGCVRLMAALATGLRSELQNRNGRALRTLPASQAQKL